MFPASLLPSARQLLPSLPLLPPFCSQGASRTRGGWWTLSLSAPCIRSEGAWVGTCLGRTGNGGLLGVRRRGCLFIMRVRPYKVRIGSHIHLYVSSFAHLRTHSLTHSHSHPHSHSHSRSHSSIRTRACARTHTRKYTLTTLTQYLLQRALSPPPPLAPIEVKDTSKPRMALDLTDRGTTFKTRAEESDGPTQHMIIIDHEQHDKQRWKMCAG